MRYGGLIAAIVFAAIAAVVVLKMSGGNEAPQQAGVAPAPQDVKSVTIYVAKTAIPIGSTVTEDMVGTQPWPEHLSLPGFMRTDNKEAKPVVGMVARGAFQQGEPLIAAKLANPNDPNFLAGDLPAGMRVVSLPLNEVDGVAGFIFPGDHVDVVYNHEIERLQAQDAGSAMFGGVPQQEKVRVTETLLTNVKVLAIDQRASNVGATDKNGNLLIPRSASLMVSQADAQRILLAQRSGTLSLVLRALADKESSDPMIVTESKDISQVQQATQDGVKVSRGAPGNQSAIERMGITIGRGAQTAPQITPSTPLPVTP